MQEPFRVGDEVRLTPEAYIRHGSKLFPDKAWKVLRVEPHVPGEATFWDGSAWRTSQGGEPILGLWVYVLDTGYGHRFAHYELRRA